MNGGQQQQQALWIAIAIAGILFGVILGYVLAGQRTPAVQPAPSAADLNPAAPAASLVDERQIQTYRDILARDPRNQQAAIQLGNLLYDAGRYAEAIPAYRQAVAVDPRNVSVSTDLGTALWYSGRVDEALAQFQKSLAINPTHAQTLFNKGIVTRDGKQDPLGAALIWQRLLTSNPGYEDRAKVEQLIAQAKQAASSKLPLKPIR